VKAIYGALGKVTEKEIEGMGTRLLHRGKHQTAKRVSKELFFGVGSHKDRPGIFADDRYTIVADASIYNRAELEKYLGDCGCQLSTSSDEEIILNLYKHGQITGINKINGEFAFAIWDQKTRNIILCRDFFGSFPLYYTALLGGGLAFSSEYKALLSLAAVRSVPDLEMIQHLQNTKKLPVTRTLVKNVFSVAPGSVIVLDATARLLCEEHMPKLALNVEHLSEQEACENIRTDLFNAIQRRVGTERTIGIALGGFDSIGLVCLCRRLYPTAQIHTFTAGYGKRDSDVLNAARVAAEMGTIHHQVETPPSLLRTSLPGLVWNLEDPCARSEALQLYELGRHARDFVPCLFSAQGADGLFGGMPKYKILSYVTKAKVLKHPFEEFYNLTQIGVKPRSFLGRSLDILYFRGTVPSVPKVIGTTYLPQPVAFPSVKKEFINEMLVNSFQYGQTIQKFDRTFAAWGVGYAAPFYDRELVETAYRISDHFKIKRGIEKYIFRKALGGIVPEGLLNVPKLPQRMNYDLEFSDTLDDVAAKYLSKERVEARGLFSFSEIERLKKRRSTAPYSPEGGMRLWTALLTEIWATQFLDMNGRGSEILSTTPDLEPAIECMAEFTA
jgi:asparagine synthase (glutamine-hydrolysing)